jgi:CRP/FNR family transcriptional regulator
MSSQSAAKVQYHASQCALYNFHLLYNQQETVFKQAHRLYHRGETLYTIGDTFDALYILRSGSAKSFMSTESGYEQISNFYFTDDIIGLEAFSNIQHVHSLKFLETSSVWRIGLKEFNRAMIESDLARQQLLQYMSQSLVDEQRLLLTVSKFNAEQRLAQFLLNLSERFGKRGLSAEVFDLSMTRIDIASFLGLAIETISRLLNKMQTQGMISVQRRQITLCNIAQLRQSLLIGNKEHNSKESHSTERRSQVVSHLR